LATVESAPAASIEIDLDDFFTVKRGTAAAVAKREVVDGAVGSIVDPFMDAWKSVDAADAADAAEQRFWIGPVPHGHRRVAAPEPAAPVVAEHHQSGSDSESDSVIDGKTSGGGGKIGANDPFAGDPFAGDLWADRGADLGSTPVLQQPRVVDPSEIEHEPGADHGAHRFAGRKLYAPARNIVGLAARHTIQSARKNRAARRETRARAHVRDELSWTEQEIARIETELKEDGHRCPVCPPSKPKYCATWAGLCRHVAAKHPLLLEEEDNEEGAGDTTATTSSSVREGMTAGAEKPERSAIGTSISTYPSATGRELVLGWAQQPARLVVRINDRAEAILRREFNRGTLRGGGERQNAVRMERALLELPPPLRVDRYVIAGWISKEVKRRRAAAAGALAAQRAAAVAERNAAVAAAAGAAVDAGDVGGGGDAAAAGRAGLGAVGGGE
jgi:hypothetical protein